MLAEAKGNKTNQLGKDSDHGLIERVAASLLRDVVQGCLIFVFCTVTLVMSLGIIRKDFPRL